MACRPCQQRAAARAAARTAQQPAAAPKTDTQVQQTRSFQTARTSE